MNAITLGVHALDVLVRPVQEIPEGQGGQLVEEIRMTAAGTAAGTAITLAKFGAVDTTGCGDTFSAGFLRGVALGRGRREAAVLGCAAAGLVAQGLGSDFGSFDLAHADAFAAQAQTLDIHGQETPSR
jgi:sugar/nucleoside kinase (ribokinase family)